MTNEKIRAICAAMDCLDDAIVYLSAVDENTDLLERARDSLNNKLSIISEDDE